MLSTQEMKNNGTISEPKYDKNITEWFRTISRSEPGQYTEETMHEYISLVMSKIEKMYPDCICYNDPDSGTMVISFTGPDKNGWYAAYYTTFRNIGEEIQPHFSQFITYQHFTRVVLEASRSEW